MRNDGFRTLAGIGGKGEKVVGEQEPLLEEVSILIVERQPNIGGCVAANGFLNSNGRLRFLSLEQGETDDGSSGVAEVGDRIAPESVELQCDRFLQILPNHQHTISSRCAEIIPANTKGLQGKAV